MKPWTIAGWWFWIVSYWDAARSFDASVSIFVGETDAKHTRWKPADISVGFVAPIYKVVPVMNGWNHPMIQLLRYTKTIVKLEIWWKLLEYIYIYITNLKTMKTIDISWYINKHFRKLIVIPVINHSQWEFQDPKMEVRYHIRPYFVGMFTYIGLKNRPYKVGHLIVPMEFHGSFLALSRENPQLDGFLCGKS